MIVTSLLLALAQAGEPAAQSAPSEAAVADEIVVIGKKMDMWRGGIFKRDGQLTCRTEKSSGDLAIDAVHCGAMVKCYAPHVEELDRIAAKDAPRSQRNAEMQAIGEAAKPCLEDAKAEAVRRLAEFRAAD